MTLSKRLFGAMIAALSVSLGLATTTSAALLIDQQNTVNSTFTVTFLPALGQSFKPALNSIDFATFILSNTTAGATYKVQVLQGAGYGGTLLGESITMPVALAPTPPPGQPVTVDNAQPVEFDFLTPIALTPGNVYTLRVVQANNVGGSFFLRTGFNNPYAGGEAYAIDAQPTLDYVFAEGVRAVPEPSSLALCGIAGLAALAFRGVRRRS